MDTTTSSCYKYNISDNYNVTVNVNWAPKYVNETVNGVTQGATSGWGSGWNFSVNVKNDIGESDDLNISLQVDTKSGFVELMKKNCSACSNTSWTQINFTNINFSCSDINTSAQYKLVVTDNSTPSNSNTTTAHTFTIDKDNVNFDSFYGNNTVANRIGSQTDLLYLKVNDANGTSVSDVNVTFYVTTRSVSGEKKKAFWFASAASSVTCIVSQIRIWPKTPVSRIVRIRARYMPQIASDHSAAS